MYDRATSLSCRNDLRCEHRQLLITRHRSTELTQHPPIFRESSHFHAIGLVRHLNATACCRQFSLKRFAQLKGHRREIEQVINSTE
jgi:hypothetical protein